MDEALNRLRFSVYHEVTQAQRLLQTAATPAPGSPIKDSWIAWCTFWNESAVTAYGDTPTEALQNVQVKALATLQAHKPKVIFPSDQYRGSIGSTGTKSDNQP